MYLEEKVIPLVPRADNNKIMKMHWLLLNIVFLKTTGPISTKLDTKHFSRMRIQVCLIEECVLFFGEIIFKILKCIEIFYSKKRNFPQNHWDKSNGTLNEGFLSEGDSSCSNEGPYHFWSGIIFLWILYNFWITLWFCLHLLIAWNCLSGEGCAQWASCLFY